MIWHYISSVSDHQQFNMDRGNAIEHLLLSRCAKHNKNGDLVQFLEQRYSSTGSQKNYLVLESTDGGQYFEDTKKEEQKASENAESFLSGKIIPGSHKNNKYNGLKTKNEFKKFVQQSLRLQDRVIKKLHKRSKTNPDILKGDVMRLKMCQGILMFEDFIEMNNLWKSYMRDLLENSKTIDVITAKLSSAEYVGAYFTVTHCSCPDNIGMEGIVIWESQTYILMIIPRRNNWKENISEGSLSITYSAKECLGGLRMIPKKNTRFTFGIEMKNDDTNSNRSTGDDHSDENYIYFEFIGDRLSIKSLDRANKKFKSHNVRDIEL